MCKLYFPITRARMMTEVHAKPFKSDINIPTNKVVTKKKGLRRL